MEKILISNVEKQAVRERLYVFCLNNYVTLLARKTNLSRATVSKFFNEGKVKSDNAEKIFDAALELIRQKEEIQENRQKLEQKLGIIQRNGQ
jgi:hypothetical protein